MLVSGETEIRTSFGPMGRSKVVRNQVAGSLILTKDGQQLLQCYLSDPKLQDPLEKALITMCCGVAKEYGDGSMSALVIMSTISKSLNISVPSRNRLHILNAVEVIIHAVEMHKKLIAQYMIDHSVWHSTNSDDDLSKVQDHIRGLWGSILLPATNIATASNIIALLVRLNHTVDILWYRINEILR